MSNKYTDNRYTNTTNTRLVGDVVLGVENFGSKMYPNVIVMNPYPSALHGVSTCASTTYVPPNVSYIVNTVTGTTCGYCRSHNEYRNSNCTQCGAPLEH